MSEQHGDTFLALADFLIPRHGDMPAYSEVCTYDAALAALDFRIDLKEGFERGVAVDLKDGAEGALEKMAEGDAEAFNALSTVAVCTYYMDQKVRELIGYPGQESVTYDSKATQPYLVDGSLAKVIARGQTYRPTPGL